MPKTVILLYENSFQRQMASHSPLKIALILLTLAAFVVVAAVNALAATSDGGGKFSQIFLY